MSRERRVLEEEVQYLGPVAIAIFIDFGWISLWPMAWTKGGCRALGHGYGRWNGTHQQLPAGLGQGTSLGAAHWPGRRAAIPVGTNIPMVA